MQEAIILAKKLDWTVIDGLNASKEDESKTKARKDLEKSKNLENIFGENSQIKFGQRIDTPYLKGTLTVLFLFSFTLSKCFFITF